MIEVSVVTGTYNRLKHMKSMVQSVRSSIGVGIPYEIVLVDGGSTDGSIEWMKSQPDIRLIEHGKLLGAVKAFNDGAYAATGRFVILANDDIEFIGHSIPSAISFMHDNPDVGIGCFYQDRRGWDWHVEQMSAVKGGHAIMVNYGQVCIVRKWLGDRVGWWGDYLRTYGGDNELSCNVWEAGYRVEPIPCGFIHDTTPMDELRKINNILPRGAKQHPDTAKWLAKWTRNGKLGPAVRDQPIDPVTEHNPVRIFYAPIYEVGHPVQKRTKRGLREALSKIGLVYEYDYMSKSPEDLVDAACCFDAKLFVLQVQDTKPITAAVMDQLRSNHPLATFVNWNGDYHPDTLFSESYIYLMKKFDLVGLVTTEVKDVYDRYGVNWFYWQIGYEEADAAPRPDTKAHDVLFLANGYSKDRLSLVNRLRKSGIKLGLYGSWPASMYPDGSNLYDFDSGARLYKACKIAISDNQWDRATGFVSNRLFQAMSAGAFLLQQYFHGMEELLDLYDGNQLCVWYKPDDLPDRIKYWLEHDAERREIAARGQAFIRAHHSFDNRVAELLDKLHASVYNNSNILRG